MMESAFGALTVTSVSQSEMVASFRREVCTTCLLHTPIEYGGPGTIVQIPVNERLMNHKPKVIILANEGVGNYSLPCCVQYHRGRSPATQSWVFGLADTSR